MSRLITVSRWREPSFHEAALCSVCSSLWKVSVYSKLWLVSLSQEGLIGTQANTWFYFLIVKVGYLFIYFSKSLLLPLFSKESRRQKCDFNILIWVPCSNPTVFKLSKPQFLSWNEANTYTSS